MKSISKQQCPGVTWAVCHLELGDERLQVLQPPQLHPGPRGNAMRQQSPPSGAPGRGRCLLTARLPHSRVPRGGEEPGASGRQRGRCNRPAGKARRPPSCGRGAAEPCSPQAGGGGCCSCSSSCGSRRRAGPRGRLLRGGYSLKGGRQAPCRGCFLPHGPCYQLPIAANKRCGALWCSPLYFSIGQNFDI